MKRARGVLFDLDGTLVDSPSVILAAFHDACAPYGAVPLPADARGLIGKPLDTILPLLIPRGDETVWEAAKALFRESFARRSRAAASTLVFPGVRELLTDLSEEGARIARHRHDARAVRHDVRERRVGDDGDVVPTGDQTRGEHPERDGVAAAAGGGDDDPHAARSDG